MMRMRVNIACIVSAALFLLMMVIRLNKACIVNAELMVIMMAIRVSMVCIVNAAMPNALEGHPCDRKGEECNERWSYFSTAQM